MPRESFICVKNEETGKVDFIPKHLYTPKSIGSGLQIIQDMQPYQNVAVDGQVIGGRRQHRDMLRAHKLIEVGDQAPTRAPSEPVSRLDRGLVNDIKRAMGKL